MSENDLHRKIDNMNASINNKLDKVFGDMNKKVDQYMQKQFDEQKEQVRHCALMSSAVEHNAHEIEEVRLALSKHKTLYRQDLASRQKWWNNFAARAAFFVIPFVISTAGFFYKGAEHDEVQCPNRPEVVEEHYDPPEDTK